MPTGNFIKTNKAQLQLGKGLVPPHPHCKWVRSVAARDVPCGCPEPSMPSLLPYLKNKEVFYKTYFESCNWNSICRPGWPRTHRDLLASTSLGPGLKQWATASCILSLSLSFTRTQTHRTPGSWSSSNSSKIPPVMWPATFSTLSHLSDPEVSVLFTR